MSETPPAPDGDPVYPEYPAYQAPYSQAPYPQAPYPQQAYPAYQPHPQAPYPPYPGGPWYPRPELRPRAVTTAATVGFVAAGLLMLAGIVLFTGASLVSSLDDIAGTSSFTAELALDGFLDLLAAGLLIAGGAMLLSRRSSGRAFYCVGAAIVVVESVYWVVRWTGNSGHFVTYALLFAALVVFGSWLGFTRDAARWLAGQPANAGNLNW